jgi:hypothetical protein
MTKFILSNKSLYHSYMHYHMNKEIYTHICKALAEFSHFAAHAMHLF